jgi:GTPase SAR1 family protein
MSTNLKIQKINSLCDFFEGKYKRVVNIGVFGAMGCGKSSITNTIGKIVDGNIANLINASADAEDTCYYRSTQIRKMKIWDARGLPNTQEHHVEVENFLQYAVDGYVYHNFKMSFGNLRGYYWFQRNLLKLDGIIVVQSLKILSTLEVHRALKITKDKRPDVPMVICFSKSDAATQEAERIKEDTQRILGIDSSLCFCTKNYLTNINGENIAEIDDPFAEMLYCILFRICGEQYNVANRH